MIQTKSGIWVPGTTLNLYGESLPVATDMYQLTMGATYHWAGMADWETTFSYNFRKNPFGGGYAVSMGQAYLAYYLQYMKEVGFSDNNLRWMSTLNGTDGQPLFSTKYLEYLRNMKWRLSVDAVPEGRTVFAWEPVVRVRGPLIQGQIFESFLLTQMNFQTLIATKASRILHAAGGDPCSEQGLRRAQGLDGALTAARACHLAGFSSTSNMQAGFLLGIPVAGTMAHALVMAFLEEEKAFMAYAQAMPNNCLFLVDTYSTLRGIETAIRVGKWLETQGHRMYGIRIDSGDLGWLSQRARQMFDEAGLNYVRIFASNDLDEYIISDLKLNGARFTNYGVGTAVVTGGDQPALGGVYKLGAIAKGINQSEYEMRIKVAGESVKTSVPGNLQIRRYSDAAGNFLGDAIYEEGIGIGDRPRIIHPMDPDKESMIPDSVSYEDLLKPISVDGEVVACGESFAELRERVQADKVRLDPSVRRIRDAYNYKVGLEHRLFEKRREMIREMRGLDIAA